MILGGCVTDWGQYCFSIMVWKYQYSVSISSVSWSIWGGCWEGDGRVGVWNVKWRGMKCYVGV